MEYRHIPTGIVVGTEKELPSALYERIDPEPADAKAAGCSGEAGPADKRAPKKKRKGA